MQLCAMLVVAFAFLCANELKTEIENRLNKNEFDKY